jgi:hypothetical protein
MSRGNFIFFCLLLTLCSYAPLCLNKAQLMGVLEYQLFYFTAPAVLLMLALSFLFMVRWFLNANAEVLAAAGTFFYGALFSALSAYGVYKGLPYAHTTLKLF